MALYKIKLKYSGTKIIETFAKNKETAIRKAKDTIKTHIQGNAKSKVVSAKEIKD